MNLFRKRTVEGVPSGDVIGIAENILSERPGMRGDESYGLDADGDILYRMPRFTGHIAIEDNGRGGDKVLSVVAYMGKLGDSDLIRFYRQLTELTVSAPPGLSIGVDDDRVLVLSRELCTQLTPRKIAYMISAVLEAAGPMRAMLLRQYGMSADEDIEDPDEVDDDTTSSDQECRDAVSS